MRYKPNQNGLIKYIGYMRLTSRETEIVIFWIRGLDHGLDRFNPYLALHHIIFKKKYPLIFINISHILTNINALKPAGKS